MDLLRHWRVRLLGGAAAAVTVPVAIVAAVLAVGAAGGGLGAFSALGQALTGPGIPEVEPATGRGSTVADDAGEILPGDIIAVTRAPERSAAGGGDDGGGATPGGSGGDRDSGGSGGTPGRRPVATRPPASAPPSSPPAPQPTPAPTEPPSTVRQVGDAAKGVTDRVPIAGEPAGEVIDLIVETADGLPLP